MTDAWIWSYSEWCDKTAVVRGNPISVSLCPSHIPHWLAWDQTLASVVKGKRLTACATPWTTNLVETKAMQIMCTHKYNLDMKYCLYINNYTHGNYAELEGYMQQISWIQTIIILTEP